MDAPDNLKLASGLVPTAYLEQGAGELRKRAKLLRILLSQRNLPATGWPDEPLLAFLNQLSAMDSNNFTGAVGAGEREGRVVAGLLRTRHWGFSHGIGRSGDIGAVQPKAAGSSLLVGLTNALALHAVRVCGVTRASAVLVLPCATGMSLGLVLASLRPARPTAKFVLWLRADQKSVLKAISTMGLSPVVVEGARVGDEVVTDLAGLRAAVEGCGGRFSVLAIVSTTSCFAPRACDDVSGIADLCASLDIPHVVNHAYGLQSSKLCHELNEACRVGRVDVVVSSTDKNFLVPVGGALVFSPHAASVSRVSKCYPGRASLTPVLDLFVSLMGMGEAGLRELLAGRRAAAAALRSCLERVSGAAPGGVRLLSTPGSAISYALSLPPGTPPTRATFLGSMLFSRGVSGARVVDPGCVEVVDGVRLVGWGAHTPAYGAPYLTLAAALGMRVEDVGVLEDRLMRCLSEWGVGNAKP